MKKPNCDCVKNINAKLTETTGKKCNLSAELISGGVLIDYFYDETTRSGKTKQKSGYIMPSYCPFCGKAYAVRKEG